MRFRVLDSWRSVITLLFLLLCPAFQHPVRAQSAGGDPEPFVCGTPPTSAAELLGVWAQRRAAPASLAPSGTKRLLLVRVDFSDLPGAPFTDAQGTNLVHDLDAFYQDMSFGKMGYSQLGDASALTPVLRMPFTAALYPTLGTAKLRADALAKATAAGYVLSNYDQDVICFGNVAGFSFSGFAYVGAQGAFLRNAYAHAGPMAHELGHNFGLNHANLWDTGGESVTGSGKEVEYGDQSDTMSTATGYSRHFNARYKQYLGWITDEQVTPVAVSGVQRVYAFDLTNAVAGARALVIARDSRTNYWVDFRRLHTNSPISSASAAIRWCDHSNRASLLLDTTPGTLFGARDAFLRPGRTFSDQVAGIHITTLGLAGTTPEALDLDVRIGVFPDNQPPVATLEAVATEVPVGTTLTFHVTASDPDGDSLAYGWDFADETIPPNAAAADHTFSVAGDYVVRCVVSDRRGGTTMVQTVVRVGTVTQFRLAGTVLRAGEPVDGVQVVNTASRVAPTAGDGLYQFANLTNGTYALRPVREGYAFNPAQADAVVAGIDAVGPSFSAFVYADLDEVALVGTGATWKYNDAGGDLGTAWRGSGYGDGGWAGGPAPLGYGQAGLGTTVGFGPNPNGKWVTTYFRKSFNVSSPAQYLILRLRLQKDDGAIVYLNNTEVLRSNLPEGSFTFLTFASEDVTGAAETAFQTVYLPVSLLVDGTNLLAVEVHQFAPNTPDCRFDLDFTGLRVFVDQPPTVSVAATPSSAVVVGTPLTLTGTVTGFPVPTLQWRREGIDLAGETAATLIRPSASLADAGNYTLVAVNRAGSVTSAPVALTILVPPAITTAPVPLTRIVGEAASFTVVATGTDPLGFQWRFNGVAIGGATAPVYNIAATTTGSAGAYQVVVANAAGSVTSAPVALTILVPPAITTAPVPLTRIVGEAASFTVVATGTDPLGFQWRFNGVAIGGATAPVYNIATTTTDSAGAYQVVVANAAGSVTSAPVALTILVPPTITTAPVPLTRIVGEAASFTVVATGTDPLGFQWRFNGVAIGGATAPVYNIATTTTGSAGAYQVVVANAAGSVTSAPVALTILVPPAITTAPVPLTRIVGEAASFTVVATGTDPLGFQWRLNGTAIGGATAPVYNIASTTTGSAGAYQVVVANAAGSVTSAPVALTVLVPPAITTTPVPLTRIVGEAASFTVVATGTDPLGFQWRLNGAAIGGATAPVYNIAATTTDSAGAYQVVVANAAGSVTSAPVALTILVPPAITTAPVPLTRIVGEAASFTVVATGTDPLGFQWRLNGTAIGGATAATYDIAAVAPSDAGLYDVEVRNGAGTLHSPSVSLTVINAGAAARLVLEMSADTGLLHLHVTGTPGAAYRVEESVDLDLWSFVTSGVCGDDGTFVVELGLPADVSARCFRAMAE